jgi:uncharacterized membrane protein YtjA (UPF0391 family)
MSLNASRAAIVPAASTLFAKFVPTNWQLQLSGLRRGDPRTARDPLDVAATVLVPIGTRREPRRLARQQPARCQEDIMFGWAIAFLVIALIAGALGFGVVAGTAFAAAEIVFVVALIAFLISGVLGLTRRGIP